MMLFFRKGRNTRTGFVHRAVLRLLLLRSAKRRGGRVRQSRTRWENEELEQK